MRAVLIDIDGVLTVSWEPLPGAVEAVEALRERRTCRSRWSPTPPRAPAPGSPRPWPTPASRSGPTTSSAPPPRRPPTCASTTRAPRACCCPAATSPTTSTGSRLVGPDDDDVDVVVLGGAGPEFSYEALDAVYRHLQHGAALVAMHRNLYWRTDAGPPARRRCVPARAGEGRRRRGGVLGKPSGAFFAAALSTLGVGRSEAVMVGDDLEADVLGAQRAGITGVLVRTGKFPRRTRRVTTATARSTSSTPSPTCPGCSGFDASMLGEQAAGNLEVRLRILPIRSYVRINYLEEQF